MKLTGAAFAGVLAAGLMMAAPALAQPEGPRPAAQRLASLAHIIEEIHRRTPGRQLDANLEQQGARQVYRVRWMTNDGRRIDYIVDAVTGAILSGG
jgi:uncharacterized membrane protein YkoI